MTLQQRYRIKVVLWTGLYISLLTAPLFFARMGHEEPSRNFGTEFGVALGFMALAMMSLQFMVTGRFRWVAGMFGADAKLQLHRFAGIAAGCLILGHVAFLLISNPENISYFDPRENLPRALALIAALTSLTLILVTSNWRLPLGLCYERWLLIHGLLSLFVVFIGLVHILQVGFYVSTRGQQVLWSLATAIAMGFLLHVRLVKPWQLARRPYKVNRIECELEGVWTMVVQANGHEGMRFKSGQFAWISVKKTPFTLQKNPYSFSSSDSAFGELAFTIKEEGDFGAGIKRLNPGAPVYLEGPYGVFTLSEDATGAFFVAGGIGITPIMSMLRSLRDRRDRRPLVLIYGNSDIDGIVFREELETLQQVLNLEVTHVLEDPPADWQGETGYIDADLMEKHRLCREGCEYFVCAPGVLMDVVETTIAGWGVPTRRIKSERFDFV